jgi:nitrite reductase (NO-forming)
MYTSNHSVRLGFAVLMNVLLSFLALGGSDAVAQGMEAMKGMEGMASSRHASAQVVDVVRDAADVPPPVGSRPATTVKIELTAMEVVGQLDPASGTTYRYWTFNGKVPGPMIRVRQGDTVEVTLHNSPSSHMVHSIDFHAAIGPGGGAALSQVLPGKEKTFTFLATTPGLFVYHCGTPMIADHIANGMYGLILVEPPGGLPRVDHEYYVMQGEIYTTAPRGKAGLQSFSEVKLMEESPEYFVFNGAVDALTKKHPLHANTGEAVRIFFGDAGPNETSSLHVVGEIFTRDYQLGSITSPPLNGVQTASIPPGGAAILELKAAMPGQFNFMDHAMARMAKGLMGTLEVTGPQFAALMHAGPASEGNYADSGANRQYSPGGGESPMMSAGSAAASGSANPVEAITPADKVEAAIALENSEHAGTLPDTVPAPVEHRVRVSPVVHHRAPAKLTELEGCVTMDGMEVRLATLQSGKIYRLQGMTPFAENIDRILHVTGHPGNVAPVADPSIPTFTVDTADELAPNCHAKISREKLLAVRSENSPAPVGAVVVGMDDASFTQPTVTIMAGQNVVWKNTSSMAHNVVDDAAQALTVADVQLPAGVKPFASGYLQPGQVFSHTFTVPGVYRYVCTLHETAGMKGVVIVTPSGANLASNSATR